jgi:hypothetical protein
MSFLAVKDIPFKEDINDPECLISFNQVKNLSCLFYIRQVEIEAEKRRNKLNEDL